MSSLYYDMQGKPIGMLEWARAFEDLKARKIGSFDNEFVHISTVWLGLDHSFMTGALPLIFETMVFPKPPFDTGETDMDRYNTMVQAKDGHLDMIREWGGIRGFWRMFWITVWNRATAD